MKIALTLLLLLFSTTLWSHKACKEYFEKIKDLSVEEYYSSIGWNGLDILPSKKVQFKCLGKYFGENDLSNNKIKILFSHYNFGFYSYKNCCFISFYKKNNIELKEVSNIYFDGDVEFIESYNKVVNDYIFKNINPLVKKLSFPTRKIDQLLYRSVDHRKMIFGDFDFSHPYLNHQRTSDSTIIYSFDLDSIYKKANAKPENLYIKAYDVVENGKYYHTKTYSYQEQKESGFQVQPQSGYSNIQFLYQSEYCDCLEAVDGIYKYIIHAGKQINYGHDEYLQFDYYGPREKVFLLKRYSTFHHYLNSLNKKEFDSIVYSFVNFSDRDISLKVSESKESPLTYNYDTIILKANDTSDFVFHFDESITTVKSILRFKNDSISIYDSIVSPYFFTNYDVDKLKLISQDTIRDNNGSGTRFKNSEKTLKKVVVYDENKEYISRTIVEPDFLFSIDIRNSWVKFSFEDSEKWLFFNSKNE